jgi:uncharacterized protein (DUF2236 family)
LSSPARQLSEAGATLAQAPTRVLQVVAGPLWDDLGRKVRRSLGVAERPRPAVMDPERAFLPPGGVVRRVHADLPSMVIGGLSALLLQSLHPLAMAGVAEHSNYTEDPTGRMRRTAAFISATTYGTVDEAERAIAQVMAVHVGVQGVAPDGRLYSAADPELLTWIHTAEMDSFLRAVQTFGPRLFSAAECDAYFDETAAVALALGAEWVPRSTDEVDAYFRRMRPQLYAGAQARAARDFLLRGVARRPPDQVLYRAFMAAAISVLPGWARVELGLPEPPLLDALVVRPLARTMCAGLRWAVPGRREPPAPVSPPP